MSSSPSAGPPPRRGPELGDRDPSTADAPAAYASPPPDAVVRIWPARVAVALAAVLPAAAAAILLDGGPLVLAVLGTWTAVALTRATGTRRAVEHQQQLATDVRVTTLFAGPIALAAIAGVLPLETARVSLLVVALAAVSTRVVRRLQLRRLSARRVVLVGSQSEVEAYAAAGLGEDLVAGCLVMDGEAARRPTSLLPTTFTPDALPELVSRVRADAVLVLPDVDVTATEVRDLTWLLEDSPVTVGIVCPVSSVAVHRLRTTMWGPTTVLELGKPRATAGARFAKALVDRSVAVVLLLATSPLLLLLWAAVRLDSKGPGFYVATRIGRDGERFSMVKLRTMHHDAGDLPNTLAAEDVPFAISRDPRVTRVGYWLRRFSLDELPQLFNVLRGEMSLVGPRPAPPDEVAEYDSVGRRRLVVKPGITGLRHMSGHRNLLWDESLRLDLYYADNWRMVDDLRIVARSVLGGTRARGAH